MKLELTALGLAALCACAGGGINAVDITKPITGDAATNAEKAYKRGLEEKSSSNFIEATRFFEWVKNNFPYSQYAALSELALADMAYDRDDFETSATTYQDFVKSHPSHPKADYASFRVGLAHFRDKASDWFLLPPSYEKDEAPVRQALDSMQRFILAYPNSALREEAKKLVVDCRERLAAHERYVADFYWKRKAWKGAAGRFLGIADTFGDLDNGNRRGDALWLASEAYHNAADRTDERATLQRLVQEAPSDRHRREADARLAALPKSEPAAPEKPAEKPAPGAEQPAALPEKPSPAAQPAQPAAPTPSGQAP